MSCAKRWLPILSGAALSALAACAPRQQDAQEPPFARAPYQPLTREAVVAIALREWRAFGEIVDDDPPGSRVIDPQRKLERSEGLWQRVGEYWWLGLHPADRAARWTGKHDENGAVFSAAQDERYAWSAAFVSYVMRMAGAGDRFPYAEDHATYINAAASHQPGWAVVAERPETYAPVAGDLICFSRDPDRVITFDDLPAGRFASHCDIVVGAVHAGQVVVVGGNVADAVAMKRVPVTNAGMLATPDGRVLDSRYPWMAVLRLVASSAAPPPRS